MTFLNRKINLYFSLSIFCFFAWQCAHAQLHFISLKDAVAATDKNYPSIKAKMNYIKAAEENIKAARREYIPSLKLIEQVTYATSNSLPGTYFSYGTSVSGSITPEQQNNPNFGVISAVAAEWPVFTFGQHAAKVDIAGSQEKLAETTLETEKFDLSVRTASAYFDLITLINLRKSQEKNLERTQRIRSIILASAKSGLKPGVDSSTANAEVSRAKMTLIDAQKNEKLQRNYLAQLTGLDEVELIPDTMFLQKLPPQLVQGGTMEGNPMISYYIQRENLSSARELLVRRSYLPRISILGEAWGRGSGISPEPGNAVDPSFGAGTTLTRFNYAIGIAAVFNISDYPRISAEANILKYQTMGLREETNVQKRTLQNQLKDADDSYTSSYSKALESPVLVQSAMLAYRQTLAMYNSGLTNITDLAQALYNLNYAETAYAISYNNVWKALLFKTVPSGDINILFKQL